MKTTLLYYPSFTVPTRSWLTNALLYWDEVGSVVPERLKQVLDTPDINYLVDQGCYRRFDPEPALERNIDSVTFEEELAFRLDSPVFSQAIQSDNGSDIWSLAFEKVNYEAWEVLKDRHLILDDRFMPRKVCRVRRPAAVVYMGLLAERLASKDDQYVKTSTDQEDFEDLIFLWKQPSNIPGGYVHKDDRPSAEGGTGYRATNVDRVQKAAGARITGVSLDHKRVSNQDYFVS